MLKSLIGLKSKDRETNLKIKLMLTRLFAEKQDYKALVVINKIFSYLFYWKLKSQSLIFIIIHRKDYSSSR